MEYGESHIMGGMGSTFSVGFICVKGPATTAMLREKIKYMLCRKSKNETGRFTIVLHFRFLDNICLYSDLQIQGNFIKLNSHNPSYTNCVIFCPAVFQTLNICG